MLIWLELARQAQLCRPHQAQISFLLIQHNFMHGFSWWLEIQIWGLCSIQAFLCLCHLLSYSPSGVGRKIVTLTRNEAFAPTAGSHGEHPQGPESRKSGTSSVPQPMTCRLRGTVNLPVCLMDFLWTTSFPAWVEVDTAFPIRVHMHIPYVPWA